MVKTFTAGGYAQQASRAGGGTRSLVACENRSPGRKIALRRWLIEKCGDAPRVLDCFGPRGLMFERVWRDAAEKYDGTTGGAYTWLTRNNLDDWNIFDLDAFASPWECVEAIGEKTRGRAVGIVATDGVLRKEALFRANMPRFLQSRMGWPRRDDALFAAIYWRYPHFARAVIERLTGRKLTAYAVVDSKGSGGVMYWACTLGI